MSGMPWLVASELDGAVLVNEIRVAVGQPHQAFHVKHLGPPVPCHESGLFLCFAKLRIRMHARQPGRCVVKVCVRVLALPLLDWAGRGTGMRIVDAELLLHQICGVELVFRDLLLHP